MASSSSGFDVNVGEDDEMMKWLAAGLVMLGFGAGCGVEDHTAVGGGVDLEGSPGALRGSYANTEGWTGMLLALKVWVEHGINLREGLYK